MARTTGAVDKRPRKRSNRPKRQPPSPAPIGAKDTATPPASEPVPTGPNPEFLAGIDAALGVAEQPQVSAGPGGPTPNGVPAPTLSPEAPLTREAWEGVLRVPFRFLALAVQSPGVARVGDKRAKDLARPSYVIFEHYATQYLDMHPDDPLSLAWAATGLVLADISADVMLEIGRARAERAPAKPAQLPEAQAVVPQAA